MNYKPTPFNCISALLILVSIYGAIASGPMGFGLLGLFYLLPMAVFGLLLDLSFQIAIRRYWRLFLIEMGLIGAIAIGIALEKHSILGIS